MLFQSKAGATEVGGAEVGGAEVPFAVGLAAVSFPAEPAVAPPVAVDPKDWSITAAFAESFATAICRRIEDSPRKNTHACLC
jgi:hypothetical protein